jgi:hypothetical protein|tara:strand:- start:426 stop:1607 length:1182 start_codon:yes stop_codon:yes gene_type:complete
MSLRIQRLPEIVIQEAPNPWAEAADNISNAITQMSSPEYLQAKRREERDDARLKLEQNKAKLLEDEYFFNKKRQMEQDIVDNEKNELDIKKSKIALDDTEWQNYWTDTQDILNSSLENMGIDEKANYDISSLLPSGKNYKHLTRAKKLLEKRMEPFKYQNDKANKRREDLNKNLGTDYSSLDNDLFLSEGFQDIIKDSIRQRLTGAMTPEQEQRLSYLTFKIKHQTDRVERFQDRYESSTSSAERAAISDNLNNSEQQLDRLYSEIEGIFNVKTKDKTDDIIIDLDDIDNQNNDEEPSSGFLDKILSNLNTTSASNKPKKLAQPDIDIYDMENSPSIWETLNLLPGYSSDNPIENTARNFGEGLDNLFAPDNDLFEDTISAMVKSKGAVKGLR